MPDNNLTPSPDIWTTIQHWGSAVGIFFGSLWGAATLARSRSAKKKGGPVGWEDALEELRQEMAQATRMATDARDKAIEARDEAREAREDTRKLREGGFNLMTRRMERLENQSEGDRQEQASIMDRLLRDMTLLKQRLLPGLSKPPERLPE